MEPHTTKPRRLAEISILLCGLTGAFSTLTTEASARMCGTDIDTCNGCHEHGTPPDAAITVDSHQVELGGTANFVLTSQSEEMLSGFMVMTEQGDLGFTDPATQRYYADGGMTDPVDGMCSFPEPTPDVSTKVITHAGPKPFVDGSATWEFSFTAPMEVGVTVLKVGTVAANGNQMPSDDGATLLQTWVAHGCEGQEYFPDVDGDGYGSAERLSKPSCEPVPDHVPNNLDCADDDPMRNPDMPEVCNAVDDNCDGQADEGLTTAVLYPDLDGDGYGSLADGETLLDCPPVAGYSENFDDCNDADASINPGMPEICNGVDDNCDRRADNDPVTVCGVGACQVVVPGCDMACTPGTPTAEVCNEIDDDCNGLVDDNCGMGGAIPPAGGAPAVDMTAGAAGAPVVAAPPATDTGGCSVPGRRSFGARHGALALLGAVAWTFLRRRR